MEIGARLHHVQLLSRDANACAGFYGRVFDMQIQAEGSSKICMSRSGHIIVAPGTAHRLGYSAFAFASDEALDRYRRRVEETVATTPVNSPLFRANSFRVTDPDGNNVAFGVSRELVISHHEEASARIPLARLQHYAVRSRDPARLAQFYQDCLKFVVSDRVYDDRDDVRAGFLRTDSEHHSLALFKAAEACHDHLSFDTGDWTTMRDWADRIVQLGMPIVWGIGRHGPGNDVFFMVRDPDGNLVELSSELEICDAARVEGKWRHEERTLNLWGSAIMRS